MIETVMVWLGLVSSVGVVVAGILALLRVSGYSRPRVIVTSEQDELRREALIRGVHAQQPTVVSMEECAYCHLRKQRSCSCGRPKAAPKATPKAAPTYTVPEAVAGHLEEKGYTVTDLRRTGMVGALSAADIMGMSMDEYHRYRPLLIEFANKTNRENER